MKLRNYIAIIFPFLKFFENLFNPVAFDPFIISKSLLFKILLKWLLASLRSLKILPFLIEYKLLKVSLIYLPYTKTLFISLLLITLDNFL